MITAAVLTHNDEKTVERCMKSLNFCDEIVVVDDNSTDRTLELLKQYPVRVIQHSLENDFAAQRNRLLEQARGEWVLFVDPDEELPIELQNEIKEILNKPNHDVYFIKRLDFFWRKQLSHGEVQAAAQKGFIRLVKKGSGSWNGKVHEQFITQKPVGQLLHAMNHYPHPTITEFIEEVNLYSTIRAQELLKQGHKTNIFEIMFLPFGKFMYTYFLKGGFQDGAPGFAYSFFMSFHSFLVRSKLYQYQNLES